MDKKDLAVGINLGKIHTITDSLSSYLQGKEKPLSLSLISFFSRGHLLIEDLPGLGKTTLAIGIAKSLGLTCRYTPWHCSFLPDSVL
jgi:MoxR-like ATPase